MAKINLLKGQKIFFLNEKLPYIVMAVSNRYIVCVRKLNRIEDSALLQNRVEMGAFLSFSEAYTQLKGSPIYTIIDFIDNIRAPNNLVFNNYDYFSELDCLKTIIDLLQNEIQLSKRNQVILDIDRKRTSIK